MEYLNCTAHVIKISQIIQKLILIWIKYNNDNKRLNFYNACIFPNNILEYNTLTVYIIIHENTYYTLLYMKYLTTT